MNWEDGCYDESPMIPAIWNKDVGPFSGRKELSFYLLPPPLSRYFVLVAHICVACISSQRLDNYKSWSNLR